jgi:DNA processing protein
MNTDLTTIDQNHPAYPEQLKTIASAPKLLYVRGNLEALAAPHLLAVVGSRKANTYGKQCIERILPPLVDAGITLVSGLAFGIDALAHAVAVSAKQPTVAVLGSGIDDDSIYPRANLRLAQKILEHGGLLISEYEPGSPTFPYNFPARNRIIAGLCRATLIIQANIRSGSLITARFAVEFGRDVCAIPGPITDLLCEGTNSLIQQGAVAITSPDDLLMLYRLAKPKKKAETADITLSFEQAGLLKHLSTKPIHVDELVAASNLPIQTISPLLMELELLGIIESTGHLRYARK